MSQASDVRMKSIQRRVLTGDVPPALGHYSHVVELPNGLVFISGQKAWKRPSGELLQGDVAEQTELIFDNLEAILAQVGLSLESVVRIGCHLSQIAEYAAFNEVYARRLGDCRPARTVLGGYQLRDGARVELVVEAYRG
jgi:2-iminobutanoate/2-iminopropanoate deaminase